MPGMTDPNSVDDLTGVYAQTQANRHRINEISNTIKMILERLDYGPPQQAESVPDLPSPQSALIPGFRQELALQDELLQTATADLETLFRLLGPGLDQSEKRNDEAQLHTYINTPATLADNF